MKTLPLRTLLAIVALAFAALAHRLPAQIAINALGTAITEDFNSIGTTTALPANWRMTSAGNSNPTWFGPLETITTQVSSSGAPTTGGRYNWGQSSGDRAIGFMTSGGYASPNSILTSFSNNTGSTIEQLSISFDYERYRINTSAASISFYHSTDGATWTAATGGNSGAFSTGSSSYGFTTLVSSMSKSVTLTSLNLSPGSAFYLRWNFSTGASNSQGLGLDNFSLTASAVPEPSTYAAMAGAASLLGAFWRRRRQRKLSSPAT